METTNQELSIREKITIKLILFIIQIIKPYEYEHTVKEHIEHITELIGLKNKN